MNVAVILGALVAHKTQIEAGIKLVEAAKQDAGFLKVARGAVVTAIQNLESHKESPAANVVSSPTAASTAGAPATSPAPAGTTALEAAPAPTTAPEAAPAPTTAPAPTA